SVTLKSSSARVWLAFHASNRSLGGILPPYTEEFAVGHPGAAGWDRFYAEWRPALPPSRLPPKPLPRHLTLSIYAARRGRLHPYTDGKRCPRTPTSGISRSSRTWTTGRPPWWIRCCDRPVRSGSISRSQNG